MPGSLRRRVDQALDIIASAVKIAHRLSIALIIAVAALLSFAAWHVYAPLIIPIVLVALVAGWYVTSKKDEIAEIVEDADEESGLRGVPKRIILKVLDAAFSTASESALLAPAGCALISVVGFLFKYNSVGWTALAISLVLFALISCTLYVVKLVAQVWIDNLFSDSDEDEHVSSERAPLVK